LIPTLRNCTLVFFDGILIYSATYEDHVKHLQQVFELLAIDQWKIKLSKCTFAQNQIAYLGHIISQDGVSTDLAKVSSIANWPTPQNAKEMRSLLGLSSYYRKFVRHFGVISQPLTALLKKGTLFI
jgi:hypothetical protein